MAMFCFEVDSQDGGCTLENYCELAEYKPTHTLPVNNVCRDGNCEYAIRNDSSVAWASAHLTLKVIVDNKDRKLHPNNAEAMDVLRKYGRAGDVVTAVINPSFGGAIEGFNLHPMCPCTTPVHHWGYIENIMKLCLLLKTTMEIDYQVKLSQKNPNVIIYTVCFRGDSVRDQDFVEMLNLFKHVTSSTPETADGIASGVEKLFALNDSSAVQEQSRFSLWDIVPVVGSARQIRDGYRDLKAGNKGWGILKCTLGTTFLVMDACMIGGAVSAAKSLVTGGAAVATKTAASAAARGTQATAQATAAAATNTANQLAANAAKAAANSAAKQAAAEAARLAANNLAKEAVKNVGKQAAAKAAEQVAAKAANAAAQAAANAATAATKSALQQAAANAARQAASSVAKQTAAAAAKQAAAAAANTAQQAATKAANAAATNAAKQAAATAAAEAAVAAAKEGSSIAAREAAIVAAAAANAAKQSAANAAQAAALSIARKAAAEAAKQAAASATNTAAQVAANAASAAAQVTAKTVAEKLTARTVTQVTTDASERGFVHLAESGISNLTSTGAKVVRGVEETVKQINQLASAAKKAEPVIKMIYNQYQEYQASRSDGEQPGPSTSTAHSTVNQSTGLNADEPGPSSSNASQSAMYHSKAQECEAEREVQAEEEREVELDEAIGQQSALRRSSNTSNASLSTMYLSDDGECELEELPNGTETKENSDLLENSLNGNLASVVNTDNPVIPLSDANHENNIIITGYMFDPAKTLEEEVVYLIQVFLQVPVQVDHACTIQFDSNGNAIVLAKLSRSEDKKEVMKRKKIFGYLQLPIYIHDNEYLASGVTSVSPALPPLNPSHENNIIITGYVFDSAKTLEEEAANLIQDFLQIQVQIEHASTLRVDSNGNAVVLVKLSSAEDKSEVMKRKKIFGYLQSPIYIHDNNAKRME